MERKGTKEEKQIKKLAQRKIAAEMKG